MKVIFLGTPAFAEKSLESINNSRHEVAAVVTQPDRINGRNKKITFSPVKQYALDKGIPVHQFDNVSRDGEEILRAYDADIMVTAAYGQILRQNILNICPKGIINVHASLLPEYRGSSPVQWAIIDGKKELGVTIMQTELGIDTGDMILADKVELTDENSEEALEKLAVLGARLVVEALDKIEDGVAEYKKQDESKATHCRMLRKEDGKLGFDKKAEEIVNFIRGMNPWPGAYFSCEHGVIKVLKAKKADFCGAAGEILFADNKKGLVIGCDDGSVEILRIKPENGKEMDAKAYLLGKKLTVGSKISE